TAAFGRCASWRAFPARGSPGLAAALRELRQEDDAAEPHPRATPIHEMAAVFDRKKVYVRTAPPPKAREPRRRRRARDRRGSAGRAALAQDPVIGLLPGDPPAEPTCARARPSDRVGAWTSARALPAASARRDVGDGVPRCPGVGFVPPSSAGTPVEDPC